MTAKPERKRAILRFHSAFPHLILYNRALTRPAVHESEKKFDSNSKQFPVLSCMSDISLFYSVWLLVKAWNWVVQCATRSSTIGYTSCWLAAFQSVRAISLHPITVKQQENRLYGRLIVIEKEGEEGEKPLTSLSISPSFLTISVALSHHPLGKDGKV